MNTNLEEIRYSDRPCPAVRKRVRAGCWTCGNSFCQEAEYHANRERAALVRLRKGRK